MQVNRHWSILLPRLQHKGIRKRYRTLLRHLYLAPLWGFWSLIIFCLQKQDYLTPQAYCTLIRSQHGLLMKNRSTCKWTWVSEWLWTHLLIWVSEWVRNHLLIWVREWVRTHLLILVCVCEWELTSRFQCVCECELTSRFQCVSEWELTSWFECVCVSERELTSSFVFMSERELTSFPPFRPITRQTIF